MSLLRIITFLRVKVCVHTYISRYLRERIRTCVHVCVMCVCKCLCMYACVLVCMSVCLCVCVLVCAYSLYILLRCCEQMIMIITNLLIHSHRKTKITKLIQTQRYYTWCTSTVNVVKGTVYPQSWMAWTRLSCPMCCCGFGNGSHCAIHLCVNILKIGL